MMQGTSSSSTPAKYGSVLSDYEIIGQLGRGATAFVYQVRCRESQ